jgi:hypothetical protein
MASSSSHTNNGIPLATLLEWYKVRDTFFGVNYVSRSIPLAIQLASTCEHPDARWLTEACAGKDVTTKEDAKRVFLGLGQNDARALCFLFLLRNGAEWAPLCRSAELGFALAQAWMACRSRGEERFKFAQLAAAQGEREGLVWLGLCFCDGEGCEKDVEKAKDCFLHASELGDVGACEYLGSIMDDDRRWEWLCRAAVGGSSRTFEREFAHQVNLLDSGTGNPAVVFAIGRTMNGSVNAEEGMIFETHSDHIDAAEAAVAFKKVQVEATKDAMKAWSLIGLRLNVSKDIRKLIAKLVWDTRGEALFKLDQKLSSEN